MTKPKYSINQKVAVKQGNKKAFHIGKIIQIGKAIPGQLGRQPGTIIYLIEVRQYIDEQRKIIKYDKPPFPLTTAIEEEMQIIKEKT